MEAKDKKQLAKRRREAARQAQKFHKEQAKQNKKSSEKARKRKPAKPAKKGKSVSKIQDAVNSGRAETKYENISREEKFRRKGEEKLRNLQPHDFEDGYYIDEYSEKQRQERRARVIRKQEKEVIRRNKKPMTAKQMRKRRILFSAGIVAAVIIIGVILSLTVLFKTEKIDIEGNKYYTDEQIVAFSNVSLQENIFLGAMNSTPQSIVKNLRYIEDAQISFVIPDTITIKLKNATPTYAVKNGNGYIAVSSKGRMLDVLADNGGFIELNCGELKDTTLGNYIKFEDDSVPEILESVAKCLKDNGIDKITGFDISDLSSIVINYDNRIKINIGLAEDLDYKIRTAFTIITEKLDPNNTGGVYGTLDVSTCNKNKISHYKPSPTVPETVPSTTVSETTAPSADIYGDYGNYNDSQNDYNEADNGVNSVEEYTYGGEEAYNDTYSGESYENQQDYNQVEPYEENADTNTYNEPVQDNYNPQQGNDAVLSGGADGATPW